MSKERLHYRVTGDGPPVVFIHGAGGSGQHFASQFQAFRDIRKCYFPDLAGHGDSIAAYAAAVIEFLETLQQPAVLLGHSMGGGIAIEVALLRPELLTGLVLACTGCKLPVSEKLLAGFEADYEKALDSVARYCFSKTVDPELLRRARLEMGKAAPAIVRADFAMCNDFDRCDRLSEITMPTLVICGAKDVMTPLASSEQLRNSIANSRLEVIPEGSHMVMIEQPERFNEVLRIFLLSNGMKPAAG